MKKAMFLAALVSASCSHYTKGLVDMGLSVKWNGCNLGARAPHEAGNYYAWGEVTPKDTFMVANSLTDNQNIGELKRLGIVDNHGHLTPKHDAATTLLGEKFRMPTRPEIEELTINCTWQWKKYKGVYGYCVTSTKTGKRIFLPAAGYNAQGQIYYKNEAGYYWSSSVENSYKGHAHDLFFAPGNDIASSYSGRYDGLNIRPVSKE